ncbi:hypothetical protein [Gordonia soli]|uniref:Uncharacterized protein n=1 Tax=Gordonia soli NBRC 108243 TaxID=1223545 RepID=M0QDQ9_9ACTN|nr:hypothetical protein [Gordonia soli]GAC66579.1 hypothetical protein GS4_03_00270 [Gordonia soli NBRC 108243]
MQTNPWVTAGGYILAAIVAAVAVIWNNRQRPHDALKTYVEIWKDLPDDSEVRTELWIQIEIRLRQLTTPVGASLSSEQSAQDVPHEDVSAEEAPIQQQLRGRGAIRQSVKEYASVGGAALCVLGILVGFGNAVGKWVSGEIGSGFGYLVLGLVYAGLLLALYFASTWGSPDNWLRRHRDDMPFKYFVGTEAKDPER